MKIKAILLSVVVLAGSIFANAQTAKKPADLFVGGGVGINSPMTPGFNKLGLYGHINFGGQLTPVWAVRADIGVGKMNLDSNSSTATLGGVNQGASQLFGELNVDGIISLVNIFSDDYSKFDVYLFAGPTANLSKTGSRFVAVPEFPGQVENCDDLKVRVGASAGLGLAYNITRKFAIGAEARFGVTPSIFGDMDSYRKAEATSRISISAVYNFNGKKGKIETAAAAAAAAGYISAEAAQAMADAAVASNPKIVEKVVEKVVEKEVVKEVVKKVPASNAIFFEIGKATISAKDKARIKLLAEAIVAGGSDYTYEVGGYADKKTGSASWNNKLSEKRAKAVYDLLVAEGVPASQLELKAYGGVDAIFFNNDILSRTVIVKIK